MSTKDEDPALEHVMSQVQQADADKTTLFKDKVSNYSDCDFGADSSLPHNASFHPVPFPTNSLEFDGKYMLHGRYGYDLDDLSRASELRELPLQSNRLLPQVGNFSIPESSVESSNGEGDTLRKPSKSIIR